MCQQEGVHVNSYINRSHSQPVVGSYLDIGSTAL